jgi:hypothetical protein
VGHSNISFVEDCTRVGSVFLKFILKPNFGQKMIFEDLHVQPNERKYFAISKFIIQKFKNLFKIHIFFLGNSEVWDIRTFHLLKTVPELDQCLVKFTNNADIIYAITLEQETGKWIFYFLFFPLGF